MLVSKEDRERKYRNKYKRRGRGWKRSSLGPSRVRQHCGGNHPIKYHGASEWGGKMTCDYCMHGKVQPNREIDEHKRGYELAFTTEPKPKLKPKIIAKPKRKLAPKIVKLDAIRPNLYVTNRDYFVKHSEDENENPVFINMSSHDSPHCSWSVAFREYSDYSTFKRTVDSILNFIDTIPEEMSIYLVCNRGVNRSVCIAILLANRLHGWTFEKALNYIETEKEKVHQYWCCLNNRSFKNKIHCYLQQ